MRTIVLSKQAEKQYDTLTKKFPRFEDIYNGMEWFLAKSADEVPYQMIDADVRILKSDKKASNIVLIAFIIDSNQIHVLGINCV